MRDYVTFCSAAFSKAPRPHYINPCCQCEELAVWLRTRLDGAIPGGRAISYQEDFGWVVEVQPPGQSRAFMVVAADLDENEETEEFGVYVEAPQAKRWLFGRSTEADGTLEADRRDLIAALDQALRDDPGIEAIQWWADGFAAGEPSAHPEVD